MRTLHLTQRGKDLLLMSEGACKFSANSPRRKRQHVADTLPQKECFIFSLPLSSLLGHKCVRSEVEEVGRTQLWTPLFHISHTYTPLKLLLEDLAPFRSPHSAPLKKTHKPWTTEIDGRRSFATWVTCRLFILGFLWETDDSVDVHTQYSGTQTKQ